VARPLVCWVVADVGIGQYVSCVALFDKADASSAVAAAAATATAKAAVLRTCCCGGGCV